MSSELRSERKMMNQKEIEELRDGDLICSHKLDESPQKFRSHSSGNKNFGYLHGNTDCDVELTKYEHCLLNGLCTGDFAYDWYRDEIVVIRRINPHSNLENVEVAYDHHIDSVYGCRLETLANILPFLKSKYEVLYKQIQRITALTSRK